MVLPTIANVDRVRLRLSSNYMLLQKLTFELAFRQSMTSQTIQGLKSSLHNSVARVTTTWVRDFLYNLCTVRDVTSQLFVDQSTTRGDNDEILPDPYTPQQRAPALSMVLPTIANVDHVRLRLSSNCTVLRKLTFELAFRQSMTSQTIQGRKSSLHNSGAPVTAT